jgi:hypothetical protein
MQPEFHLEFSQRTFSPSGIWRWNPYITLLGLLKKVSRFPVIKGNLPWIQRAMHSDINPGKSRHSRESGNPGKNWIPGQARNDKRDNINVVMYR